MKRLSILLLALLLAVSMVFVSCESNPNKENTEQKTEAEVKEFNEVTANAVVERNKELAGELKPYIKTIEGIMKNPDDITSLVVKLRIEPKNSGDTFSFTTAEDYKAYKSCLEKYNETAGSGNEKYIPDDSELVPKKYKYVDVTWNVFPEDGPDEISYSTDTKGYKVKDFVYGKTNDNPLGMDVQCFVYAFETDTNVTDLISTVLEIAKVSPTFKGSVEIGVKGTTYVLSFSESLSSEGKSIIIVDNISIKQGETTLASFKCRSSVKFSDDFSLVEKYDAATGKKITTDVKGSVTFSFADIELLLGDGTYSLTGSIDGTLDFTTQRVVVNCTLTEKIKNIEFIALDITFDITKAVMEKADNVENILDCLKIFTFRVAGTEYSAESVKKYISTLLSEKAAE